MKMTKKEEMYVRILNVKNDIKQVEGKANEMINVSEYMGTAAFYNYISKRKLYELEKELEIAKQALVDAQKKVARDAWLLSEEGKAYTEQNEAEKKAVWEQILALRSETHQMLAEFVRNLLGEEFGVTRFSESNFQIGLIEKYDEDGEPRALFGHEFEVYFGYDRFFTNPKFKFELNYGTMGSFDLGADVNRPKYLAALAKFAGSTQVNVTLKKALQEFSDKVDALRDKRYNLEKEYNDMIKAIKVA